MLKVFLTGTLLVALFLSGCAKREETPKAPETNGTVVQKKVVEEKVKDLVCGMEIEKKNALKAEYRGTTYYFDSDHCKMSFMKDPDKYLGTKATPTAARKEVIEVSFKDPVCGMTVDEGSSLKTDYKGKTYYFCGVGCKTKFEQDPEKYLK